MDVSKSRNAVKIKDGSSSRGISIIMDGISSRTARIDSRDYNNIQQGHQQQQQELTTRKFRNSSRNNENITDVNSRRETSNSKETRNSRD
jgi:hypothetical protein